MATMGGYFSNYSEQEKQPPVTEDKSKAFWDNPGFWAKVGEIGSALVGGKTRLGQAAKYAAGYHNAQQLDLAQRKVLQNAAAGVDPMTGMTGANTQGLSAEQISKLSDTGVARQSALVKEEREGKLAESTIKSGEAYRDYIGKLASQIDQKMAEKKTLDENWADTIKGVEAGTIKSKYITPETLPLFKMLGREESEGVIKEIMKEQARFPKTHIDTDREGGKIRGIDQETGVIKWTVPVTPKKEGKTPGEQVGFVRYHTELAANDLYPYLKEEYLKNAKSPQAAKDFDDLFYMTNPNTHERTGLNKLLGLASPELKQAFRVRLDEYNNKTGGYADVPPLKINPLKAEKTTPAASKKEADKFGTWMATNESAIVGKLKGKPAGIYKFPNGAQVQWDGTNSISVAVSVKGKK